MLSRVGPGTTGGKGVAEANWGFPSSIRRAGLIFCRRPYRDQHLLYYQRLPVKEGVRWRYDSGFTRVFPKDWAFPQLSKVGFSVLLFVKLLAQQQPITPVYSLSSMDHDNSHELRTSIALTNTNNSRGAGFIFSDNALDHTAANLIRDDADAWRLHCKVEASHVGSMCTSTWSFRALKIVSDTLQTRISILVRRVVLFAVLCRMSQGPNSDPPKTDASFERQQPPAWRTSLPNPYAAETTFQLKDAMHDLLRRCKPHHRFQHNATMRCLPVQCAKK